MFCGVGELIRNYILKALFYFLDVIQTFYYETARRRREHFGGLALQYLNDLVIFHLKKPQKPF